MGRQWDGNRTVSYNAVPATKKWEATMDQKDKPIVSMTKEEREEVWDDAYAKEEGIIIEFNPNIKYR